MKLNRESKSATTDLDVLVDPYGRARVGIQLTTRVSIQLTDKPYVFKNTSLYAALTPSEVDDMVTMLLYYKKLIEEGETHALAKK